MTDRRRFTIPLVALVAVLVCASAVGCGLTRTDDTPTPTATTEPVTVAPPITTTVAAQKHFDAVVQGLGKELTLYGNADVVVADGSGQYRTYTSDGKPLGSSNSNTLIDRYCGIYVSTRPDGVSALYTMRSTDIPAAGLTPAQTARSVAAWDPKTFDKLWETEVAKEPSGREGPCSPREPWVGSTIDGKWLTISDIADTNAVIDTATGQLRKVDFDPRPVGTNIGAFQGDCANCLNGLESVRILNPTNLEKVGEVSGRTPNIATQDPNRPLGVLTRAIGYPDRATWFRDGARVAVADAGQVRILNTLTNTIDRTLPLAGGDTAVSGSILLDEKRSLLLVREQGSSTSTLRAFSLESGAELWNQPGVGRICAIGDNQVNVIANNQMVLLDETTGKQLDYTAKITNCDAVFGSYTFNTDGTVYKLVD